ncbi:hypothetical protein [Neobacillus sp. 204]|uniref:hypothetical protein n=1 Tax=Neobacillus sp. 204 TaxID=3383351 RepID=UPI00397D0933
MEDWREVTLPNGSQHFIKRRTIGSINCLCNMAAGAVRILLNHWEYTDHFITAVLLSIPKKIPASSGISPEKAG